MNDPAEPPVRPVCAHCGSDNLARDASARWNVETQSWEISGIYDATFCDDCEAESDELCEWVPVDERSPDSMAFGTGFEP